MADSLWVAIGTGALCGGIVGLERQRSGHAAGAKAHFGGFRTFTLLGVLGGAAGWLWTHDAAALASWLIGGAAAVVAVAFAASSRYDIDGTTEVAALVVLAAGLLAGVGQPGVAGGTSAATALLLAEKHRLHGLISLASDTGFRAGLRFAVMAAVVLPLLPDESIGWLAGVRPRQLWLLVLLFSGLSFAGYAARAWLGDARGLPMTGLLGGLVSSTTVTLTFARLSRDRDSDAAGLADGAIAACTVLFVRVVIAAGLLAPAIVPDLARLMVLPCLAGAAVTWSRRRPRAAPISAPPALANPLAFRAALQMAILFQLVWVGVDYAQRWFGDAGLLASSVLLGLTDVDALTASIALRAGRQLPLATAAQAIAAGIAANTALKCGIAGAVGAPPFRRPVITALLAMLAAIVGSMLFAACS